MWSLTVGEKASGLEEGWKQGSLEEYNYPSESHSTPVPGNAGEPSAPNSLGLEGRSTTDHFSVLSWTWKQEDPLEEAMAAHSSILAWRIPGTDELGHRGTEMDKADPCPHRAHVARGKGLGPGV